jgi:transcriptional regulator with XRE-family HTH domain
MTEAVNVGERVQEEREWMGLTRAQVASMLGLTEQDAVDIETGARPVGERELRRLADLFGLESPARLQGEPIPAIPNDQRPVCMLADGRVSHEDLAAVARFAEFLRNSGPALT